MDRKRKTNIQLEETNTGSIIGEKLGKSVQIVAQGSGYVAKEAGEIGKDVAKSGAELLLAAKSVTRTLSAGLEKGTSAIANYTNKMEKKVVAYDPNAEKEDDGKPGFFSSLGAAFKKGYNS